MKFYYNGELVRTSKTHEYSHGVLHNGKVVSCHAGRDLAVKAMNSRISQAESRIRDCREAVAAIERGERFFWTKFGGSSYRAEVVATKEHYLLSIEQWKEYQKGFEIVELEAR